MLFSYVLYYSQVLDSNCPAMFNIAHVRTRPLLREEGQYREVGEQHVNTLFDKMMVRNVFMFE